MREVLLKPKEVAEVLGVTPQTIRTWIIEGRLVGFARGGRWLIRKEALDAFLKEEQK